MHLLVSVDLKQETPLKPSHADNCTKHTPSLIWSKYITAGCINSIISKSLWTLTVRKQLLPTCREIREVSHYLRLTWSATALNMQLPSPVIRRIWKPLSERSRFSKLSSRCKCNQASTETNRVRFVLFRSYLWNGKRFMVSNSECNPFLNHNLIVPSPVVE